MKKIKNNKIIQIVISLIVIILTLLILSNVVKALVNLKKITTTNELAEYVAENATEFVYEATPGQIFALNARNDKRGISIAGDNVDVYYKSTICIFHSQASKSNTKILLTNIVDIEAPGNVVVYKYEKIEDCSNGEVGTIVEDGNKITEIAEIIQNGTNKKYKVTYTKTVLDLTDAEQEDFEKVAYLMNRAMQYKIDVDDKIQNSNAEAMIDWFWKNRIKDYIADRGVLDPYFDIDTYQNTDQSTFIQSMANEAQEAANNIIKVELTKGDTVPEVEYTNGKAYIGPLLVNYSGGTTSIKVKGKSGEITANWTTKNEDDETFNKEMTGNITSGKAFYAVVDESELEGVDSVNVKVYLNYTKSYKARFALANNKTQKGQNLMFFAGNKDSEKGSDYEEWNVENLEPKYGDLIIQKNGEDNATGLQGVEFSIWKAVSEDTGYLRLVQNSQFIEKIDKEIDINDYEVEYVGINELDRATKFVTNSEGKIVIRNLEYSKGSLNYNYWAREESNNNYGYKGTNITIEDVTIEGGNLGEVQEDSDIEFTIGQESTKILLTVRNNPELAPLEIVKVGKEGTALEDVSFKIKIGTNEYLQLHDVNGLVTIIKGEVTINEENIAIGSQYSVKYVTNESDATIFTTNEDGIIRINNLEVNASKTEKYKYTAYEMYNPNYGYGSKDNSNLIGRISELKLNETNKIQIDNKQHLGNLKLEKYDEDNNKIKLSDVGFAIQLTPGSETTFAYLALYNQNGELVSSVGGTVRINGKNVAKDSTDAREYEVRYYYSNKEYSEMTEEEKANLTIFLTGNDGVLTVNNLEVYSHTTGEKYTYKLIETTNSNYGYVAESVELGDIKLESDSTTNVGLGNEAIYTKLSGYVWIENTKGKSNEYDCVYTNTSSDIKLTDLYLTDESGKVTGINSEADIPVKVKLYKKDGTLIKDKPDEFDRETGEYTFIDVEIEELPNYQIVFIYDGFYYTTVVEYLELDNGSKVKEVASERDSLNNKFAIIQANSEIIAKDGTTNTVTYSKDGTISTVSELNFDTTISANTRETDYNLKQKYDELKASSTEPVDGVDNINMGLVLREQPQISVNSDIYNVLVNFEGYQYNYIYDERYGHMVNENGEEIGVKYEQENTTLRYSSTVYASDIQYVKDFNANMKVSITYKIQLINESNTLSVMPRQVINYFDSRYEISAVGLEMDTTKKIATNTLKYSEPQEVSENPQYKSTVIDFNQMIGPNTSNFDYIYITFELSTETEKGRNAIEGLLEGSSTFHNASEIFGYTSYYGKNTSKMDGKQYITDITKEGNVYAGIDKVSQPGNMEIKLINHPDGDGTQILDASLYEKDTSSAPSLLLEASESRKVSGTVWEDSATNTENNQKLGDGIFDKETEKTIANVTVELHKVNENGTVGDIAKYTDGTEAITISDENGSYTFGYTDETARKYVGVLPGKYIIQYTYNNQSYIVGGEAVDPNEYKSTIITSEIIQNAFNGQNERWYLIEEKNSNGNMIIYSDAKDDITLRPEYNSEIDEEITVTNSTYNNILSIEKMHAFTPIMDIGIEFTQQDEAKVFTVNFVKKVGNIDFGIIERPDVDITIEKEITGLELLTQNGATIIPMGDPSNPNESMQYVKTGLPGLVEAEIESDLLHGAKLNLKYTITLFNNSDLDYKEQEYYYYGIIPEGAIESTPKALKVVDYLDATMSLITEENENMWKVVTAEDLYEENRDNNFVSKEVYTELKTNNYHILITEEFRDVGTGNEKSVELFAERVLASSDSIREENRVEIIEVSGVRTIKQSVPGNYNPATKTPNESDDDDVVLLITPPTGIKTDYILYGIAGIVTLTILTFGIILIKKKVIRK